MLVPAWIKVERSRVGYVTACVIRYHRDVIADLALVRIALLRIKQIAHRDVGRPGDPAIRAPRIEQLRIDVVSAVPGVVPHGVQASARRDSECAEPMPATGNNRIVVDPDRRAEALAAVCAARKHHFGSRARADRQHARQHVNVVVIWAAGAIHRQE